MFAIPTMTVLIASTIAWLSLIFFYRMGRNIAQEEAIENTILYLTKEGYVKYTKDENGEIELHKLED